MASARKPLGLPTSSTDGSAVISRVLRLTNEDMRAAELRRKEENARRIAQGSAPKSSKPQLNYSIYFGRRFGDAIADALRPFFGEGVKSGEIPSHAVSGSKRVDVRYSTAEMGLGLAVSLKSVHRGEKKDGDANFIHNMKRNDEEFRVEATGHHLRQPYSVLVAVLVLPFQACSDIAPISSFARWVEYLWPLKGRLKPEDRPDTFELVSIALYSRTGNDELGFYELGGDVACPKQGRPERLLAFADFIARIKEIFDARNGQDFVFAKDAD